LIVTFDARFTHGAQHITSPLSGASQRIGVADWLRECVCHASASRYRASGIAAHGDQILDEQDGFVAHARSCTATDCGPHHRRSSNLPLNYSDIAPHGDRERNLP
jgi:hypothetical protein